MATRSGKPESPGARIEGAGPLLVYIAGLDGTGELFFKQKPSLVASYRVATFRSRERGQFTYDDLADDVAAIIRAAGDERATIIGESFGGTVALIFALRYPAMVDRLVVVNSFPRFPGRIRIRLAVWLASIIPFRITWVFRKVAVKTGLKIDGVSPQDSRRVFEVLGTIKREAYIRRLRLISEVDIEDLLTQIKSPTLFIAGEKDPIIASVREAHRMAALVPKATVKVIEGAGHACLLGERVRLSSILGEWAGEKAVS